MSSATAAEPIARRADDGQAAAAPPVGQGGAIAVARPWPWLRRVARRGLSYRASLVISLALLVAATGLAVSLLAFRGAHAGATALAHALFQEVSDHAVTKTRGFLLRAVPIAEGLGNLSDLGLATAADPERLQRQLLAVLRANPGVSWVSFSDEAGSFVGAYRPTPTSLRVNRSRFEAGRVKVVEHDVLADGSWKVCRLEEDSGYDPRTRPFYQRAKAAGRLVWPPPYIFYDQGVPGVTCANPVYDATGQLRGVWTVDFDLNMLSQFVRDVSLSPRSRLFIMSSDGVLLAHPTHRPQARLSARGQGELVRVGELDDPLIHAFDAQLGPGDRQPAPGGADRARQFEFRHEGVDYYARATTFRVEGDLVWVVGAMAPKADFIGAARRTMAWAAAASLVALAVAVVLATFLARRVSGPVLSLVALVRGVGAGDLTGRADFGGPREFRQLSAALNRMIDGLRDRTRMRESLAVATEVQQALLPARAPDVPGLDIHGFSAYCDETGGDYFDYIVPDQARPGTVLFAVGDVMGHGVGSALVMASARAVLRSNSASCGHLGELLTHLNTLLVPDMGGRRFITMLLWLLDLRGGTACWANAGHNPALVYDPRDDRFEESGYDGIPLGIYDGVTYKEHAFGPVRPGQVIVLGTDGVWETANERKELYGEERLRQCVRAAAHRPAREIAEAVRRDLGAFRGPARQRDDVTLVVIKVEALPQASGDAAGEPTG